MVISLIKLLFVCHGNICRSPMAEFIMKDLVKKKSIEKNFYIESCATSTEEIGNDIYNLAKESLKKHNIPFNKRWARQITLNDFDNFDYIIGMDSYNIDNLKKISPSNKIIKLRDFDIEDPWYTNNFEKVYEEIYLGCLSLLNTLLKSS